MMRTLQGALAGLFLLGATGVAAAQETPHHEAKKTEAKPHVVWIEEESETEASKAGSHGPEIIIKILKDGQERTIHLDGSDIALPHVSGKDIMNLLRPLEKMVQVDVEVEGDEDHEDIELGEAENFPRMLMKRLTGGGEWDTIFQMDDDGDEGACDGDCKCSCHKKRGRARIERRMGPGGMRRMEGRIRDRIRPEIRRKIQKRMQGMRGKGRRPKAKARRKIFFGGMPGHDRGAIHAVPAPVERQPKVVQVESENGKTFTIEVSPKDDHPQRRLHVVVEDDGHGAHGHAEAHGHARKNVEVHVEKDRDAHPRRRVGGRARPHHDGRRDKVAQRLDRLMRELDRLKKELRELRREL